MIASGSMIIVAAYQTGLIKHLPEPPFRFFDADKVDASEEAFAKFATPDAILGLGSYAVTMGLAAMGGEERSPLLDLALAGKVAFDVANAAKLTVDQWRKQKAFCFWCLIAASATFAMAPLVASNAVAAFRALRQHEINGGAGPNRDEEARRSLRRSSRSGEVPLR